MGIYLKYTEWRNIIGDIYRWSSAFILDVNQTIKV